MIPGYRTVQGYVPEVVYKRALVAKGRETWDGYIARALEALSGASRTAEGPDGPELEIGGREVGRATKEGV